MTPHDATPEVAKQQIERFRLLALKTTDPWLRANYTRTAEFLILDLEMIGAVTSEEGDAMCKEWVLSYFEDEARQLDGVPAYMWGERLAKAPRDLKVAAMKRCGIVYEGGKESLRTAGD